MGSANVDYVLRVAELPRPGETVPGEDLITTFGGKGANAAVAAARLGGAVRLVGCVGKDAAGDHYLQHLRDEKVDLSHVCRSATRPTGSAIILVDAKGQNVIAVAPGANGALAVSDIESAADVIKGASVLLCQFEVPMECVVAAIRIANASQVPVVLNPSPMNSGFAWDEVRIDFLIVNEVEARPLAVTGDPVSAAKLRERGFGAVIMTRGAEPTMCATSAVDQFVGTYPVNPVDTVGAGDTFAGAFAVALSGGMEIESAISFANAAAALATTRMGAQTSMPTRAEVNELLLADSKPVL